MGGMRKGCSVAARREEAAGLELDPGRAGEGRAVVMPELRAMLRFVIAGEAVNVDPSPKSAAVIWPGLGTTSRPTAAGVLAGAFGTVVLGVQKAFRIPRSMMPLLLSPGVVQVLAAPSNSPTLAPQSSLSHGQTQPSSCHIHFPLSDQSMNATTPKTIAPAQRAPTMPFVRPIGRGKKPGRSTSVAMSMMMRKAMPIPGKEARYVKSMRQP